MNRTVIQSLLPRLASRHGVQACLRAPTRPRPSQLRIANIITRLSSSNKKESIIKSTAKAGFERALAPFENVTIYNAGTLRTSITGFTRVATIFVFFFGTLTFLPRVVADPTFPSYWIPVILVGSATPFIITAMATAPFVSTVRMAIPQLNRRTQATIEAFAKRVPADTEVNLLTMRFVPWPTHRKLRFDQLRRIPEGKWRSTNLAVPQQEFKAGVSWVSDRLYHRYYIDRGDFRERTNVPGIMDIVWEQIPYLQEPGIGRMPVKHTEKLAAAEEPALVEKPVVSSAPPQHSKRHKSKPPPVRQRSFR